MNKVLDFYRLLIEGACHPNKDYPKNFTLEDGSYILWNCKDLLNDAIRDWNMPEENNYVSEKAYNLWKEIAEPTENINSYWDSKHFKCAKDNVKLDVYKGGSNEPDHQATYSKGEKIRFNDIFTVEHIIPVKVLYDELLKTYTDNGNKISDEEIVTILNKMCIARVTKYEDKHLDHRFKRENTFEKVYKTTYSDVDLLDYKFDKVKR